MTKTTGAKTTGAKTTGRILVGTASWADSSLIGSGGFYPPEVKTPEDRLRYYASRFPLVEAVLRLHGRNASAGEAKALASSAERFNYHYSKAELRELVLIARRLAEQAAEVHVVFNNNFGSYAQDNALDFQTLIET